MRIKHPDNSWILRSEKVIAQGALTNSKRPSAYVKGVFPSHVTHGESCYIWDAWGNRYLDFVGGLGTNILGYGHAKVTEAVQKVLSRGPSLSLPTVLEVDVAERLTELTGFPKVRFFKTGTEACMAAVRIARAGLNKDSLESSLWSDGYHGWSDMFVSLTKPALGICDDYRVQQWEPSFACKDRVFITEPLQLNIDQDREKINGVGGIKIFDEIITGFRVPQNFVYKWWDCKPDILCLGKALANGYPLAAVLMDEEYAEPEWFASGTYCGELMSLAACKATLDELAKKNIKDLFFYANRFMDNVNKIVKDIGVELKGYGTRGAWDNTQYETALLMQELCKSGVIIGRAHFYNYAHMEANIDSWVLDVFNDVVSKIKNGKAKLECDLPRNTFKR